jgi:hypothetical protein
MGRYFVVLDGARSGVRYVIAEVVREPTDDGNERDLSLAGNLAGSLAMILTEEELLASSAGRVALRHWRAGNDTSFGLDTLAHNFDIDEARAAGAIASLSLEEAHLLVERGRRRASELRAQTETVREQSRAVRDTLQSTLGQVQAQRSKTDALLAAIEKQMDKQAPTKRRHLRSVS